MRDSFNCKFNPYIITVYTHCSYKSCQILFNFFANSLMPSMEIGVWFFSCYLWSSYQPVHFLSMWLSGINTITKSNGDSASPWKMPLWIFIFAKLFPPVVSSALQFFINFMTLSDILWILRQSIIQNWVTILYAVFSQSTLLLLFSVSFCCPWGCVDQCIVDVLFHLFPCSIQFILSVLLVLLSSLLLLIFSFTFSILLYFTRTLPNI